MTKIKLCGLTRPQDIAAANIWQPDYIGFVFAPKSRRYIPPTQAAALREQLSSGILAVGVFVQAPPAQVAALLHNGTIDLAQLHGGEDSHYISALRKLTDQPILQAFSIRGPADIQAAKESPADLVLLDTPGGGTGRVFDWHLVNALRRPYFLAGGLSPENVRQAVQMLHPYGIDVSSGIETDGGKDPKKIAALMAALRDTDRRDERT